MKFTRVALTAALTASCFSICMAQTPQMKTFEDSLSYVVGVDIAKNLSQASINLNPDLLAQGYIAQKNQQCGLSQEEISRVMQSFQAKMAARPGQGGAPQDGGAAAADALAKGRAWLAENKSKPGVITTPSGLQYKILKSGSGESPALTDQVTVHYEGHTIDGKEFDNSFRKGTPLTYNVNGFVKGWQEALVMMKPGDKFELYVPTELGYGVRGFPPLIGPNETLIFTMELISFTKR